MPVMAPFYVFARGMTVCVCAPVTIATAVFALLTDCMIRMQRRFARLGERVCIMLSHGCAVLVWFRPCFKVLITLRLICMQQQGPARPLLAAGRAHSQSRPGAAHPLPRGPAHCCVPPWWQAAVQPQSAPPLLPS